MANRLKQFRVAAGFTQAAVAKAAGVTQPTYQRWEAGSVDVPIEKLPKLAEMLNVTKEAILGRHSPIEVAFYDDSAPEDLQYFGEVSIHFCGGGESLLLSISEQARRRIFSGLHQNGHFLVIKDLGNRTVAIRRGAIADLYLSSDAYDDYGPEHEEPGYEDGTPLQFPDPRDWEIIQALAHDGVDFEDFASEDVERVQNAVMITDAQYEKLVIEGLIQPDELETEKVKNSIITSRIFQMATEITYQLSSGQQRSVDATGYDIYQPLCDLVDDDGLHFDEDSSIILQVEGYHRAVFINPNAVDYISIPTHLLQKSADNDAAAMLDDEDRDD
jgi:transcriptional regulator with XRE-family HTH domain